MKFGAVAGAVALSPEIAHQAHNLYSIATRPERPQLITPKPYSVLYGCAPDQNSLHYLRELDIEPQILNFFMGGYGEGYHREFKHIYACANSGIIPVISWGVRDDVVKQKFHKHQLFPYFMSRLRQINGHFIMRAFYERNIEIANRWWGECTDAEFREGWKYMYKVFKYEGINCSFLFSPNSTSNRFLARPFDGLYPGDEYVHYVALDTYKKHNPNLWSPEHLNPKLSAEHELGHDIATFQRLAPSKKFFIAEVNEYGNGQWTTEIIEYAIKAGAVGILTFDWNKAGLGEVDWRISRREPFKTKVYNLLKKDYWVHNHPEYPTVQNILKGEILGLAA